MSDPQNPPAFQRGSVALHGSPDQLKAMFGDLAKAQLEFGGIEAGTEGQAGNQRFKYARLAELKKATRAALGKYGLAVVTPGEHCMLVHKDGAFLVVGWDLPDVPLPDQPHLIGRYMQTIGLLKTYGRRYGYRDLLNLDDGDDLDSSFLAKEELPANSKPQVKKPDPRSLVRTAKSTPKKSEPKAAEPEPQDDPEAPEETQADDSPPCSEQTAKELNAFLQKHKFTAAETIKACERVTGKHPDELLSEPGGEALAVKLMDHLRLSVEKKAG